MRRCTRSAVPALALLALVAACGDDTTSAAGPGQVAAAGATTVSVTLTDDGCPATPGSVPAGPTTFRMKNDGGDRVSEVEVVQGTKILGEKETLAPGLSGTFSLDLDPGAYEMYCPGAKTERTPFTVTSGTGPSAAADAELATATADYATYVKAQTAMLVTSTTAFATAVEAGDVAKAKSLYAPARVFYERIEPVAESFGDLDPEIDARINDVDKPEDFKGFHKIEQALFVRGSAAGMAPVARELVANVNKLAGVVSTATYKPEDLANGASSLLDEVAKSKVTGEEENYSHVDLVDFSANIEGARKAYDLLRPALEKVDGTLATVIDTRFTAVEAGLAPYRRGASFVPYTALSKAQVQSLAQSVDALAEPLSQVAAKIVTA